MLKIDHLTFFYPHRTKPVIDDFSMELPAGGVYGLLGRNGAGKSTFLYLIAGLLTPKSGNVAFAGTDTRLRRPKTLADIFIVPEEFNLPSMSLDDYINLYSTFYPNFSREDMQRHLSTFELPADLHLGALSMGQKKKAYMCFALACNTPLLLMDEPTNGLDIPGKAAFRRFIASSMTDDRTVIISTHQVRDINSLLDHVVIMDNRSMLLNASMAEIRQRLAFVTTDNPSLVERAIYAQAGVQGVNVIIPNDGSFDTDVDLETLFELSATAPEQLAAIFPNPQLPPKYEN